MDLLKWQNLKFDLEDGCVCVSRRVNSRWWWSGSSFSSPPPFLPSSLNAYWIFSTPRTDWNSSYTTRWGLNAWGNSTQAMLMIKDIYKMHNIIISFLLTLRIICYNTTVHYTTLHYTTLLCTSLHYNTIHNTTQQYTSLHYTTRHYSAVNFTTLHLTAPHCTSLHCTTQKVLPIKSGLTAIRVIPSVYPSSSCLFV